MVAPILRVNLRCDRAPVVANLVPAITLRIEDERRASTAASNLRMKPPRPHGLLCQGGYYDDEISAISRTIPAFSHAWPCPVWLHPRLSGIRRATAARAQGSQGLGEHEERRLSLPRKPLVRKDEARQIHGRVRGAKSGLPTCLRQALRVRLPVKGRP